MENKLSEQMEAQADAKRLLEQQTRRIVEIDAITAPDKSSGQTFITTL